MIIYGRLPWYEMTCLIMDEVLVRYLLKLRRAQLLLLLQMRRFPTQFRIILKAVIHRLITTFQNISTHIFTAVASINNARIICSTFVFIFLPAIAPKGEAIKLAITMMIAG